MRKIGIALSFLGLGLLAFSCKGKQEEATKKTEELIEEVVEAVEEIELEFSDMHNSQNSLDWAGTYEGLLPCADCPGIEMQVELNYDNSYRMQTVYQDRDVETHSEGSFDWDQAGGNIYLQTRDGDRYIFKVQEGSLRMLDQEGNIITGELENNYILKQTQVKE